MNPIVEFPADAYAPLALYFTRDGEHLYSCGVGKVLRRWSVPARELEMEREAHANSINTMTVTPDEMLLVTGSEHDLFG